MNNKIKALAIVGSTGGPSVLHKIFSEFKYLKFDFPIFITQHIKQDFLQEFVNLLQASTDMEVKIASDNEIIKAATVYVAPDKLHLQVSNENGDIRVKLMDTPPENYCKPAADPMLRSLAKIYKKNLLSVVLTGIGEDGLNGCKEVVNNEGCVVSQDAESCVVYGMPKAVFEAGVSSKAMNPSKIAEYIKISYISNGNG